MKKKMQVAATLYVPFKRSTDSTDGRCIVEGHAYVTPRMEGEKITWLRSAIEDATPDYLRWGNIREMHQPKAVGKVLSGEWDERGLFIRAEIVDADCIEKVEKGVYSGFSMGIKPLSMRGFDVVRCKIGEISVVDQPKDDTPFAMVRGEGTEETEVDFEEDRAEAIRASFEDYRKNQESSRLRYMAIDWLGSSLYDIAHSDDADRANSAIRTIQEFSNYIVPVIANVNRSEIADFKRVFSVDVEELERVQKETDVKLLAALTRAESAEARVKELEALPKSPPPVKYTEGLNLQALNRTFASQSESGKDEELKRSNRIEELLANPGTTDEERQRSAIEIGKLKAEGR